MRRSKPTARQLNEKIDADLDALQIDFPICVFRTRKPDAALPEFAADYYARNRYGCGAQRSGVLLVLDLAEKQFTIEYYGQAQTLIGDEAKKALSAQFASDCRDDTLSYYDLFAHGRLPMPLRERLFCAAAGIAVGLLAAFLTLSRMKKAMRVRRPTNAGGYLVEGSLRMEPVRSHFLYSTVSRSAKPKSSGSSGASGSRGGSSFSSGRSSGGSYSSGGRRF